MAVHLTLYAYVSLGERASTLFLTFCV